MGFVVGGLRDYYRLLTARSLDDDRRVVMQALVLGGVVIARLSYGPPVSAGELEGVVGEIPLFRLFYGEVGISGRVFRDTVGIVEGVVAGRGAFEKLYYGIRDRGVRRRLGAFFTKPGTARMMAGMMLEETGGVVRSVLDPAVGGGTLLAASLEALSRDGVPDVELYGVDVDPAALFLAYANIAYTVWRIDRGTDVLSWVKRRLRLSWNDYILRYRVAGSRLAQVASVDHLAALFDAVIANPPWVHVNVYGRARSRLYLSRVPARLLRTLSDLWGAGHGVRWPEISRAQPPIALVFLYHALRHFRRAAVVLVTGTVLKSWNTAGFRQWLAENYDTRIVEIYCREMEETTSWPVVLGAGHGPGSGHIDYRVIVCRNGGREELATSLRRELVSPLTYPSAAGPWATPIASNSLLESLAEATRGLPRIGELYQVYRGANTNAAGVFVFREVRIIGGGLVEATSLGGETVVLEPDLLHVFVRGARLRGFGRNGYRYEYILLPHDTRTMQPLPEEELRDNYPHTYRWLTRHRRLLEKRSRSPKPWYRVMDISAHKVKGAKAAWRKHDILLDFTTIPEHTETPLGRRLVIPDGTIYYITTGTGTTPNPHTLNHKVVKILAWMTAKPKGGYPYREYYSWHIALLPYEEKPQHLDQVYEKHKTEINKIIKTLTR